MRVFFVIITMLFLCIPITVTAESDGELRGEILGEYGGEAIAAGHPEYEPEKAKVECRELFESKWRTHFDEMGFGSGTEVVYAFVGGCMKGYNEKFGK